MRLPPTLVLLCASAAAACAVHAQAIYRSVGPDGKMIFSDRPLPQADGGPAVAIGGKAATPRVSPAGAGSVPTSMPTATATTSAGVSGEGPHAPALRETRASDVLAPLAAAPRSRELAAADPALRSALTAALGLEHLVNQTTDTCTRIAPIAASRYTVARSDWLRRNGANLGKAGVALNAAVPSAQQAGFTTEAKAQAERRVAPADTWPAVRKAQWCDESIGAIERGDLDLARSPGWGGVATSQLMR